MDIATAPVPAPDPGEVSVSSTPTSVKFTVVGSVLPGSAITWAVQAENLRNQLEKDG